MMLRGVCFEMREGVLTRGGLRLGAFISLMRVADNDLGAEGGAAVGQSLTALTALQTLDLSCKVLICVMLLWVYFEMHEGVVMRGCLFLGALCR